MSHLFKNNKKIFFLIKLIIFIPIFLIFFNTLKIYTGNKLIYVLFSLVSIFLIFFSLRKKFFFYEAFFSFFLFMGFWFKFSYIVSFKAGFTEGLNSEIILSPKNFDDALLTSTVGILSFILFGYLREIFVNYPQKIILLKNTDFYKKNRNIFLIIFISLVFLITFSNYHFQIYQRGLVGTNQNFIINGFVKTCLLYFMTLCITFFLYFDYAAYKKASIVILALAIVETFLSSVSMLSRGMIFNSMAIVYGLYKFTNKINLKFTLNFYLKYLLLIFLMFSISVVSTNYLRMYVKNIGTPLDVEIKHPLNSNETIYKDYSNPIAKQKVDTQKGFSQNISTYYNKSLEGFVSLFYSSKALKYINVNLREYYNNALRGFSSLMINRWVGIDSMLIVTKHKEILNLSFFKESLKERFNANSPSFYELNFNIYGPDRYKETTNKKGNTLPGLITYLFFSGSYFFLIVSMMFCCLVATLIEYLIYKSTYGNLLASSIIGMVISYRFAHFGYLPAQSYLLFGSIIGIICLLYLFKYFFNFLKT